MEGRISPNPSAFPRIVPSFVPALMRNRCPRHQHDHGNHSAVVHRMRPYMMMPKTRPKSGAP